MAYAHPNQFLDGKDIIRALYRLALVTGDMVAIGVSYWLAYTLRFGSESFVEIFPVIKGYPPFSDYLIASPYVFLMWFLAFSWVGVYRRVNLPAIDEGLRLFHGCVFGTIFSMSAMFLYRDSSFSRLVFGLAGGFSFFTVFLLRQSIKSIYIFWIRIKRKPFRVLILGKGYLSRSLQRILESHGDRAILKSDKTDMAEIKQTINRSRIQEVLIANSKFSHKDAITLANFCEKKDLSFRLLPDILEMRMGEVIIDESLGVPTFHLKPVSLHGTAFLAKRVMDVILASLVLGVFFVPLLLVTLAIKVTSPGPMFYRHKRMGFKGQSFNFLKFRTMVLNADDLLEKLKEKSDRKGHVFKMKLDPRVTKVGQFLRRFSIDEIPQLLNVLKGEMSIIGPRPQVLWETQNYDEWARKRLNVLPGITGLWQVSGRAELTFEEMIELDIYYIEHWSPGLDFKILVKTLPAVVGGKGAY